MKQPSIKVSMLVLFAFSLSAFSFSETTWRGLVVAPEHRCSDYDKAEQYPYSRTVEDDIIEAMDGKVYGPYTGRYFSNQKETDIEHIVAASEAHDSGLCAASAAVREAFSNDLLNLTLAHPDVNRCNRIGGKCALDAADWLPLKNQCWFSARVVQVKLKYEMTVDAAEAKALEAVLSTCDNVELIFFPEKGS